jgi:hypothetical protein
MANVRCTVVMKTYDGLEIKSSCSQSFDCEALPQIYMPEMPGSLGVNAIAKKTQNISLKYLQTTGNVYHMNACSFP